MCLIELGLIAWGIFIIGSSRVSILKYRVVHGGPATIIGWLLLVPIGVGMVMGFKHGFEMGKVGRMPELSSLQDIAVVELIVTGFVLLLSVIIFCCYMERPGGYRPSWEGDDYQRWGGGDTSGPPRGATHLNSEEFFHKQ